MGKIYEIRDPIHGFISLNAWEWDIINHPAFQRLRRIKQLAWTDMVYPGAMHTRFEHSLGVMHVATLMYDQIINRSKDFLKSDMTFDDTGLLRDKTLIRLAALLHDVGHSPFSHAGEGTMDINPETKKPYKHEDYSAAIVSFELKDVIECHPINENYHITAEEISNFLKGDPKLGRRILWRPLISSQFDADRADYLLRDSYHIGVQYGKYDLNRFLVTMKIVQDPKTENPSIGIEYGGLHAAEALIIARYMMFTQVYFHHTRRAYDHHIEDALKILLKKSQKGTEKFPSPTSKDNIKNYLEWDDWKVLGLIKENEADEPGKIIINREHARRIYETQEVPTEEELTKWEEIRKRLSGKISFLDNAENSWYKFDKTDLNVIKDQSSTKEVIPLSELSSVIHGLRPIKQKRIYVPFLQKEAAQKIVDDIKNKN